MWAPFRLTADDCNPGRFGEQLSVDMKMPRSFLAPDTRFLAPYLSKRSIDVSSGGSGSQLSSGWRPVFRERIPTGVSIDVAQWVEHQFRELTVTGSTPVVRSKLAANQLCGESVHQ